jgi:hypothetical protein
MELRLYKRLCKELLGSFAQAQENKDPEYQRAVEAYAGPEQTGIDHETNQKIRSWVEQYNHLQASDFGLRYYQILALYFTEHVLSCQRNGQDFEDQKALVYWMATGSGKTLLMHLNILQYIEHIGGSHGFDELEIIVTTPGVNLIQQHEQELGKFMQLLNRECNNRISLIIETTSALLNKDPKFFNLPEKHGRYRLVLVDEGHIGLSAGSKEMGAFKKLRQDLLAPANSFLFEYSATYHGIADKHVREYEGQIVFDYNYYRFFQDGYGKDFALQSIKDDRFADPGREEYENFMATFSALGAKIQDYNHVLQEETDTWTKTSLPGCPLLAFMGNTVVDPKKEGKEDEVSDIRKLLRFLALLEPEDKKRLQNVFNGHIQGKLRLSRRPGVPDLVWLSWGEGGYWGLINVGNGEKFVADCEGHEQLMDEQGNMLVELFKANIIADRYHFNQIDTPASPVNVLIGSRKFAEGWNCFRVSVIGLINLGASKGNKVIQIFGRGVRLHGRNRDGKRRFPEHIQDYEQLALETDPGSRIRRLETLNVFSLKQSYLQTFLRGLEQDLPVQLEYPVALKPRPVRVRGRELPFEEYSAKLKAPKVGKKSFQSQLRIVWDETERNWTWAYEDQDCGQSQTIPHFPINLDYRPSQEKPVMIQGELREWLERNECFIPVHRWRKRMENWETRHKVQFLVHRDSGKLEKPDISEVLNWVNAVSYLASPWDRSYQAVLKLLDQIQMDVMTKVRNMVVNDINKRNYRMDEVLRQSDSEQPGDFAERQNLHLACKNESDREQISKKLDLEFPKIQKQLRLDSLEPKANFHIYGPLFDHGLKDALSKLNILNVESTPPLLNPGESKFVRDLTAYLRQPALQESPYEFYLMRNEPAMRSVGIYLQTELQAFFPDFVLWTVDETTPRTTVVLVDPKGQTGIVDRKSLETNEKVNIATNGHLDELAHKLKAKHNREFRVHSFILLRDSSELGSWSGAAQSPKEREVIQTMLGKNVLRLDWSETNENGDKVGGLVDGQSYLDMMFEKLDIS